MTIDEITNKTRVRYLDPNEMCAYVLSGQHVAHRLERAQRSLETARAPRGRFGLDECPQVVIAALEGLVAGLTLAAQPLREYIIRERARGVAWDTIWNNQPPAIKELGFTFGCSDVLNNMGSR